jgi:hypothetical protein
LVEDEDEDEDMEVEVAGDVEEVEESVLRDSVVVGEASEDVGVIVFVVARVFVATGVVLGTADVLVAAEGLRKPLVLGVSVALCFVLPPSVVAAAGSSRMMVGVLSGLSLRRSIKTRPSLPSRSPEGSATHV